MMNFFNLPPKTMTLTAVILGYLMIDDLNAAEQNELGNFLILIGQVLETNAAGMQLMNNIESNQRLKILEDNYQELLKYVKSNRL